MIYLQNIKLSNFKCFEQTPDLQFGKLTLLTGANSTGKSSLMYGVLGVLQSKDFPLSFSSNGDYVQMGNFLEMAFKHDATKTIGIEFSLIDTDDKQTLYIKTAWKSNTVGNIVMKSCECDGGYYSLHVSTSTDGSQTLNLDIDPSKNVRKENLKKLLSFVNSQTALDGELADYVKYAMKETHIKNHVLSANSTDTTPDVKYPLFYVWHEITAFVQGYNSKVNYISSYRQPAQRTYTESPVSKGKITTSGEGFINELLSWKDNSQDKFADFVEAMKSIGLLSYIEPMRLEGGQFKVGVKVHENDEVVNLSDVGFGISQTMPIIIGDIELGKGSTLYVSQPEVHLHPSAQAKLGNYLVGQMNLGKRYVIETHSEYLMNRLRLAVVKGDISEDDIKIYYMRQEQGMTEICDVKFRKNGQIDGAPSDFFDTYMMDVMDIAMNAE